jgi:Tol biopolymer transport system component
VLRGTERGRRAGLAAFIGGVVSLAIIVSSPVTLAGSAKTQRVSISNAEAQAKGESGHPTVSKTGRYVTFFSTAGNLVSGDTNGQQDCFVRDRSAGTTKRVSVSSGGAQANGSCGGPSISNDGNVVAFDAVASNLVGGDTNGDMDIFVRDIAKGTTTRVSVATGGAQADEDSQDPMISGNGRYVVFDSVATNLVPGDTNGKRDVFVHDLVNGTTERVSVRSNGAQAKGGPSLDADISADGRFVVFRSGATNLVNKDRNGKPDIFVHDRVSGKTELISKASNGARARGGSSKSADISGNGRYVVFDSAAKNLVKGDTNGARDVFIRDRKLGKTKRVSVRTGGRQANGNSEDPTISSDGRKVAFNSRARNLVKGDTNGREDVFIRDRKLGKTKRVSVSNGGRQARGGHSDDAAISASGRVVVFESEAKNLVSKDTNGKRDIFRRGPV